MKIVVIDGQGGKMGAALTKQLIESFPESDVISIGTNSMATEAMLKAGAKMAATGENPVVVCTSDADFILGPMGILTANSLLGEITPRMAMAVSESPAKKVLIPVNKCSVSVVGVREMSLNDYIREALQIVKNING